MDFLKRSWAQLGASLGRLSFVERGFIISVAIILVMALTIGLYFASKPQRVPIPYGGEVASAVALLESQGIDASASGNQLLVSTAQQHEAISTLAERDRMGGDATEAFAKLVKADPWETNAQLRSKYMVALQTYLSKVIMRMNGVRSASVMIALPEHRGFGRTTARPSASVMVQADGGGDIRKPMVQALASLVSGAVAEMTPQDVEVIDGNGRSYRVNDPADQLPTEAIELVRNEENYHTKKIQELLRISGAIVAVSVDMDPVRKETREQVQYMETEPIRRESNTEIVSRDMDRGGEAGVRPNTGADINGSGGVSREHSETTTETEFAEKKPTSQVHQVVAGHQIKNINVTINIPRNYFVRIFTARNPDQAEAPDDAALQPIITQELAAISDKVQPLIARGETKGTVKASMYFDEQYLLPTTAGGSSGLGAIAGDYGGYAFLSVLGLVALGLMFYMVKRTTQQEDLPTVEELAGIPTTLPTDDELLGEAEEVESTMSGVELDEKQLLARKMSEQISEMIKSSPQEAGNLLGKWVAVDE